MSTYHNPPSIQTYAKRKLKNYTNVNKSLAIMQGFCCKRYHMEQIQESAKQFKRMADTISYRFVTARNRKSHKFTLTFRASDFYHAAGLQHLTDLEIPRNTDAITWVQNNHITDEYLKKSKKYNSKEDEEKDIESRIRELQYLEQYLDCNNFIRIFQPNPQNQKGERTSKIECEFIIESQFKKPGPVVYICIRKREEDDTYVIVSFFKENKQKYGGVNLYWMQKVKIEHGTEHILMQNKNYKE